MWGVQTLQRIGAAQATSQRVLLLTTLVGGHAIKHIFSAGFFVILPDIKAGLALSNSGVGALSTVRIVCGGLTNFPAGYAADRFRHRFAMVLTVCMMLIGVFQFALGRVDSYVQAIIFSTLVVIAVTFWHPAAIGTLARSFSDRRGFAIALHGTGGSIGEALGPILTGGLLVFLTWRSVLEISIVPAVLAGLLLWLILRSFRVEAGPVRVGAYLRSLNDLFRQRKLLLILCITGGFSAAQGAVNTFLPVYIREDLGLSTWVLGADISLAQVVGIGSQPVMGLLSDRLGRRAVILPTLCGLSLACLLLYVLASGVPFVITLALLGAVMFPTMALMLAAAADLVSDEVQSTTVSLMFSSSTLFAGLSPLLGGVIADEFGVRTVFLYASTIAFATVLFAAATRWQGRLAVK
jgi:MFS family permease